VCVLIVHYYNVVDIEGGLTATCVIIKKAEVNNFIRVPTCTTVYRFTFIRRYTCRP